MAAASAPLQTITRLTPLAEVLAAVDSDVQPVTPRTLDVTAAAGRVLAADAVAPARPSAALALQDGWALAADDTLGAGGYAPVLLMHSPQRVEAGQPMPVGTDSVAPFDAVKVMQGRAEALVTVNPGDGVLPAGGDSDPGIPLRQAGERLRITDLAVLACAGLARVTVREPRLSIVAARADRIIAAAASVVARDIERQGGTARIDDSGTLDRALRNNNSNAVVIIGSTGLAPTNPNAAVSPGVSAMPCTTSRPARASVCALASLRQLPVPPMITTALLLLLRNARSRVPLSSIRAVPPCRSMSRATTLAAAAMMRSARAATIDRRGSRTVTRARPAQASAARSVMRRRSPAWRSGMPGSLSPPAGNTPSPGLTVTSASARPCISFTASNGATLSVPTGIGCPASTRCGLCMSSTGA